jgi:hypothetical protein
MAWIAVVAFVLFFSYWFVFQHLPNVGKYFEAGGTVLITGFWIVLAILFVLMGAGVFH